VKRSTYWRLRNSIEKKKIHSTRVFSFRRNTFRGSRRSQRDRINRVGKTTVSRPCVCPVDVVGAYRRLRIAALTVRGTNDRLYTQYARKTRDRTPITYSFNTRSDVRPFVRRKRECVPAGRTSAGSRTVARRRTCT